MTELTAEWVKNQFAPRARESHKGTYGTLLSVCGSYGMVGAAVLAARGAQQCGTGLVRAVLPASVYPIAAVQLPEAVFSPYTDQNAVEIVESALPKATAVLLGCGLGTSETALQLTRYLLKTSTVPTVIDADGINLLSAHMPIQEEPHCPLVFTPHCAEVARLIGWDTEAVRRDRVGALRAAVDKTDSIVVLKGDSTLIGAPSGKLFINPTGNPGMATAGSGDVLAGMIAGLLAQNMPLLPAVCCAVFLHGMAGDEAALHRSQHAMQAGDILNELGGLFLQIESAR